MLEELAWLLWGVLRRASSSDWIDSKNTYMRRDDGYWNSAG